VNSKSPANTVVIVLLVGAILLIGLAIYIPNTRPARKASIRIPILVSYFQTCGKFVETQLARGTKPIECTQDSDNALPNSFASVSFHQDSMKSDFFYIFLKSPKLHYRYDSRDSLITLIEP
jgi:hypothetical protein